MERAELRVDARRDLLDDGVGIVDLGHVPELLEMARRAVVGERLLEAVGVEEDLVVRLEVDLDLVVDLVREDAEQAAVALDLARRLSGPQQDRGRVTGDGEAKLARSTVEHARDRGRESRRRTLVFRKARVGAGERLAGSKQAQLSLHAFGGLERAADRHAEERSGNAVAHGVGEEDRQAIVVELLDVVDIAGDLRERTVEGSDAHAVEFRHGKREEVALDERRQLQLLVALLALVAHRTDEAVQERQLAPRVAQRGRAGDDAAQVWDQVGAAARRVHRVGRRADAAGRKHIAHDEHAHGVRQVRFALGLLDRFEGRVDGLFGDRGVFAGEDDDRLDIEVNRRAGGGVERLGREMRSGHAAQFPADAVPPVFCRREDGLRAHDGDAKAGAGLVHKARSVWPERTHETPESRSGSAQRMNGLRASRSNSARLPRRTPSGARVPGATSSAYFAFPPDG